MNALTKVEAKVQFEAAISSATAEKYAKWIKYLFNYWKRKEDWCKSYRKFAEIRGNHTNNFSETTMRIVKDRVLGRVKAFNAVSLLDSIVTVLERYYSVRLLKFAHGKVTTKRKLLRLLLVKAKQWDRGNIERLGENTFRLASSDGTKMYNVDLESGMNFGQNYIPTYVHNAIRTHYMYTINKMH